MDISFFFFKNFKDEDIFQKDFLYNQKIASRNGSVTSTFCAGYQVKNFDEAKIADGVIILF